MNNDPMNNGDTSYQPTPKFCPHCGKALPEDAAFCDGCGTRQDSGNPYSYSAPSYVQTMDSSPLKTSDYVVMFLISAIPLIGLILMLVWSFSEGININRRNFCRAFLIVRVISVALTVLLVFCYAVLIGAAL